ncbi:ABC transporter permease [Actibacterium sp. 188UL27-1]|uniref:ABC transporter permease n=1 Tax=Actibacterium sp. 188UL27-1 TaxID=2786961 RepID=UPI001956625F|nr:ABC transporter permease [Actibacterium sp. 188UL27-1]MBM7068818.1 ABC transporter permease [Actibacterium sp. 188UL27-1]
MTHALIRLTGLFVVIFGIALITFALAHFAPGDKAQAIAHARYPDAMGIPPQILIDIRAEFRLDDPFHLHFLNWFGQVLRGDFGVSYSSGERVWAIFLGSLGETVTLTITSLVFGLTGAFILASLAARYPGSIIDRAAVVIASVGAAMPGFWLALLLILAFAVHLQWLPAYGTGTAAHLVLPALTLALWVMASQTRLLRSFFLDARAQPFMETLRLRGHSESELFYRHTLRHAMAPALTMIGLDFASLMEGAIIIELTFARSGIGSLFAASVLSRDLPLVMFLVMFFAVIYVLINTSVELVQRLSDPRMSEGNGP